MKAEHLCYDGAESVDGVSLNGLFRFNKSSAWAARSEGQPQAAQRLTRLQAQPVPDLLEPSCCRIPHDGEQPSRIHHTYQQEHSSQFLGYTGMILDLDLSLDLVSLT